VHQWRLRDITGEILEMILNRPDLSPEITDLLSSILAELKATEGTVSGQPKSSKSKFQYAESYRGLVEKVHRGLNGVSTPFSGSDTPESARQCSSSNRLTTIGEFGPLIHNIILVSRDSNP
jgi:hypothetical protein